MGLKDSYDFDSLVNDAERLVLAELETQLAGTPGGCSCQECVLDMAAYALNNVKPSYRVSLMGSVYSRSAEKGGYAQDVRRSVQAAIEKVRANPSHD